MHVHIHAERRNIHVTLRCTRIKDGIERSESNKQFLSVLEDPCSEIESAPHGTSLKKVRVHFITCLTDTLRVRVRPPCSSFLNSFLLPLFSMLSAVFILYSDFLVFPVVSCRVCSHHVVMCLRVHSPRRPHPHPHPPTYKTFTLMSKRTHSSIVPHGPHVSYTDHDTTYHGPSPTHSSSTVC